MRSTLFVRSFDISLGWGEPDAGYGRDLDPLLPASPPLPSRPHFPVSSGHRDTSTREDRGYPHPRVRSTQSGTDHPPGALASTLTPPANAFKLTPDPSPPSPPSSPPHPLRLYTPPIIV